MRTYRGYSPAKEPARINRSILRSQYRNFCLSQAKNHEFLESISHHLRTVGKEKVEGRYPPTGTSALRRKFGLEMDHKNTFAVRYVRTAIVKRRAKLFSHALSSSTRAFLCSIAVMRDSREENSMFFTVHSMNFCYNGSITMRGCPKGSVPRKCLSFLFY